MTSKLRAYLKD